MRVVRIEGFFFGCVGIVCLGIVCFFLVLCSWCFLGVVFCVFNVKLGYLLW